MSQDKDTVVASKDSKQTLESKKNDKVAKKSADTPILSDLTKDSVKKSDETQEKPSSGSKIDATKTEVPKVTSNWIALSAFVVIVGILAAVFVPLYLQASYREIHLDNDELVKEVFFSGKPWLVYCANGKRYKGYGEYEYIQPPQMELMISHKSSVPDLNVGIVDCLDTFKSGKTLMERFDLEVPTYRSKPVGFYTSSRLAPKTIPEKYAAPAIATKPETIEKFVSFLKRETQVRIYQIKSQKDIQNHCIQRKYCVVAVINNQKQLKDINAFINKYRFISFSILDANHYALDFTQVNMQSNEAVNTKPLQEYFLDFDKIFNEKQIQRLPGFRDVSSESYPKLYSFVSHETKEKYAKDEKKEYDVTVSQLVHPLTALPSWTVDSFLVETLGSETYGALNKTAALETRNKLYSTESYSLEIPGFIGIPNVVSIHTTYLSPEQKIQLKQKEEEDRRTALKLQKKREMERLAKMEAEKEELVSIKPKPTSKSHEADDDE